MSLQVRATYMHAEGIGGVAALAGRATRAGGRLLFVGEGTAGVLGFIDASEMPGGDNELDLFDDSA